MKMVKKGEPVSLKWDEYIAGGEKAAKRLSFEEVSKLVKGADKTNIEKFEKENLGRGAYDYIPVFRFVKSPDCTESSSRTVAHQWFRKAVEAEKLRLSLPIVEVSEFIILVNTAIPEDRAEIARLASSNFTPVMFVWKDYFYFPSLSIARLREWSR